MIRVTHVSLPPGLSALAHRGPGDEVNVYVSDALPPDRQRAAVRAALHAARRPGWRGAMLPVPALGLLIAACLRWLGGAGRLLRAHWAAFGTAAGVVAATSAVVYFAMTPHGHHPLGATRPTAPATSQPATPAHTAAPHPVRSRPAAAPTAKPQAQPKALATVAALPTPSKAPSPPPTSAPAPSPTPSASSSPPPRPTPSPTPHRSRHCLKILGIWVCVGVGA